MKNNSSMRFVVRFGTTPLRRFALSASGFVVLPLLLAACSQQKQAKVPQMIPPQAPHVCKYEKVEGRFRWYDGEGYNIEVKGQAHQIEVASSGRALELFNALKPDIAAVAFEDPKKDNKVFATGKLSTCSHYMPPYNAGSEGSMYYGQSEEYLRQEFTDKKFILEGWYIKKPFIELQYEGDTMNPIKRTALKTTDFEFLGFSKNIRRPMQDELKKYVR